MKVALTFLDHSCCRHASNRNRPICGRAVRVVVRQCLVLAGLLAAASGRLAADSTLSANGVAPLLLDDSPALFAPQQPPTEAQLDRVEAVALFCAGRAHERREAYADALRSYQRALRYDPQSSAIARSIISTAVQLVRYDVAIRYALKAVELEDPDPALLRGLGSHLAQEGDWARAIALYEKALASRAQSKETADDVLLRMEMGRLCCLTERYKQGAENFARVLYAIEHRDQFALDESLVKVLLGTPTPTYQLMGECFLLADRADEALAVFQKADQLAPNRPLHQFNLARVYAKTGKPSEALSALEAALAGHLDEQGTAPYESLAEVLDQLEKKNELLGRLEKLWAAEPHNAARGYFLATQYRAAGKFDKAETIYLELLAQEPTITGYRSLAAMYRQCKRFDALLTILGEALEKTSVLEILGAEAQEISGDAESVRELLEAAQAAMKSAPEKCGYGMRLAAALFALEAKQYDAAGEYFNLALAAKVPSRRAEGDASTDAALRGSPSRSAELLMIWGVGLLSGGKMAEAAKVFQRGIDEKALADDNPAFHFYLAGALAMAKRPDEALAAAETAAAKKPDSARHCGRPAWVLYMDKRYGEAAKAYCRLLERFDSDHSSPETREVLCDARLALSNMGVIKGDMSAAGEWLEQVLDEFPDDRGALNDLGYLWADQNKHLHRAKRMIEKAVAADSDNMAYRDSLGWVLFRLGDYAEAVAELRKASAGPKPDALVLDHLGDAYHKNNQRDEAVEAWRNAADVYRAEQEIEKAAEIEKKMRP